jgi:hypothetical protein
MQKVVPTESSDSVAAPPTHDHIIARGPSQVVRASVADQPVSEPRSLHILDPRDDVCGASLQGAVLQVDGDSMPRVVKAEPIVRAVTAMSNVMSEAEIEIVVSSTPPYAILVASTEEVVVAASSEEIRTPAVAKEIILTASASDAVQAAAPLGMVAP